MMLLLSICFCSWKTKILIKQVIRFLSLFPFLFNLPFFANLLLVLNNMCSIGWKDSVNKCFWIYIPVFFLLQATLFEKSKTKYNSIIEHIFISKKCKELNVVLPGRYNGSYPGEVLFWSSFAELTHSLPL